jgi:purine-cytosine permease-like protein
MYAAFMAIPLGTLAFAVLAIREIDQSFVDTYSTAVSIQNLRPHWDRRVLVLLIGALATVLGLSLTIADYQNFLILIGSVFVPLFGVFAVDYFFISRGRWDVTADAPQRWVMLLPWLIGFVAYQLVNPGYVSWWAAMWQHVQDWLHFTPTSWMSASIISFVVAALATVPVGLIRRRRDTVC